MNPTILRNTRRSSGLVDTLKGDGPFTVLAPTDEAYAKISRDRLDDLLGPSMTAKVFVA